MWQWQRKAKIHRSKQNLTPKTNLSSKYLALEMLETPDKFRKMQSCINRMI